MMEYILLLVIGIFLVFFVPRTIERLISYIRIKKYILKGQVITWNEIYDESRGILIINNIEPSSTGRYWWISQDDYENEKLEGYFENELGGNDHYDEMLAYFAMEKSGRVVVDTPVFTTALLEKVNFRIVEINNEPMED